MDGHAASGPPARISALTFLVLGTTLGLVAGLGELGVLATQRLAGRDFLMRSRDAIWMIPAMDAALLGLAGIVVWGIHRASGGRVTWRVAAPTLAALAAMLVVLGVPRLHQGAAAVLAAGIGVQAGRLELLGAVRTQRGRRMLVAALGALGLTAAVTVGARRLAEQRPAAVGPAAGAVPNVLILLLDSVRARSLSLYGYARATSPALERLADGGVAFDLALAAAPWTLPSHAALFTGRWTHELNVSWTRALGPRWPTLAEVLRARGYATAGFAANTYFASYESGLHRGFERYEDYAVSLYTAFRSTTFGRVVYRRVIYPSWRVAIRPVQPKLPVLWRLRLLHPLQLRSAAEMNASLLTWVDGDRTRPFFAFVNYMDAHTPYTPPDSFRHMFRSPRQRRPHPEANAAAPSVPLTPADVRAKLDAYEGAIAYLDSEIGRLMEALRQRGLLDSTLVIVTSDHGEEFAEHGLVDHGNSLYRASLHIPLIVHLPSRVPAGRRVSLPVSTRNVAATVLDLIGAAGPRELPGRSLARLWRGGPDAQTPDTILASVDQVTNQPAWYPVSRGEMHSIALGGWRLIRNAGDGQEELYDFVSDSLERYDIAATDRGRALRRTLGEVLDSTLATGDSRHRP